MRSLTFVAALLFALPAGAEAPDFDAIVDQHILGGYDTLRAEAHDLAATARTDCAVDSAPLRAAYHDAFDAWIAVSHLRFGPSETEDRAFALAFWPDSRGATPKSLSALLRDADPVAETLPGYQTVSIAARGFYALEFLLFDPQITTSGDAGYHCQLVRVVTADIADTAGAIRDGWADGYGDLMRSPGNDTYRDRDEVAQQLFTALTSGLEFTADVRLGRPMGSFDRPRPLRAEARRSERSLRHVVLSLNALRDLAGMLSDGDPALDATFERALELAARLDDPVFAKVDDPQGRLMVENLQQAVNAIRDHARLNLGPRLGIAAGFNALDGD